eukprot:jgi/Bigna1/85943/estExt_fgenesh1_pg.C_70069
MGQSACKMNEVPASSDHEDNLEKIERLKEEVAKANAAKEAAEKRYETLKDQREALEKEKSKESEGAEVIKNAEKKSSKVYAELKQIRQNLEDSKKKALALGQQITLLTNISTWSVLPKCPKTLIEGTSIFRVQVKDAAISTSKLKSVSDVLSATDSKDVANDVHVVVVVVDEKGQVLGQAYRTPKGNLLAPLYIICPSSEDEKKKIKAGKRFIFFQIKHEKMKQDFGKMSTRCFAFHNFAKPSLDGKNLSLQLFKKPTDFTRDPNNLVPHGKDNLDVILTELHGTEDHVLPDSYVH